MGASIPLLTAIGHLKSEHRLDRCWLKGALGDALHAISCAAGYNLRWLLRAIARLGIGPAFFLRLFQVALCAVRPRSASYSSWRAGLVSPSLHHDLAAVAPLRVGLTMSFG